MIAEPLDPKCLPKNPARQEPIIDKKIKSKYIQCQKVIEI